MNNKQTTSRVIESISLDKLAAHPDNPNKISRSNFTKLVRNIKLSGRYEPLVVRPCPDEAGFFQIINGHHRRLALTELGYKSADCIVWDVDDEQTDILLATLNRLGGSDELCKKLKLLKRLNKRIESTELSKLMPQTKKQIERLGNLKMPSAPARMVARSFANPMVFFLSDAQQRLIEGALSLVKESGDEKIKAAKRAAALTIIARSFLDNSTANSGGSD